MTVLDDTRAALRVLEYANHHGLPAPVDVDVTPRLRLGFDTLADLAEWALAMESVIDERDNPAGLGCRYHLARGTLADVPLDVWAIEVATHRPRLSLVETLRRATS